MIKGTKKTLSIKEIAIFSVLLIRTIQNVMKKLIAVFGFSLTALFFSFSTRAQDAVVQEGEFGIGAGASHYFGDLNTRAKVNVAKICLILYRY